MQDNYQTAHGNYVTNLELLRNHRQVLLTSMENIKIGFDNLDSKISK